MRQRCLSRLDQGTVNETHDIWRTHFLIWSVCPSRTRNAMLIPGNMFRKYRFDIAQCVFDSETNDIGYLEFVWKTQWL